MAGIYIHIPYCRKICHYCDFYRTSATKCDKRYLDALLDEISQRKYYLDEEEVETIYFGGGTPSVLAPGELNGLISWIRSSYKITRDPEITIEVNPDDITAAYVDGMIKAGVNRVSIGVQSLSDPTLRMMNRRHNRKQALAAIELFKKSGISNISADLIYGVPGMKEGEWEESLKTLTGTGIVHLSAYHLTIEEGTPFGEMLREGTLREPEEEESLAQYSSLIEISSREGFIHYEISNFARNNLFAKHNTNYWKQKKYIGFGPSAHSYNGISRQWNISDTEEYIANITSGKPYFEREELDPRTKFNEYIMTSLRTIWGIDLNYVEREFEKEGADYVKNISSRYISYGMMKAKENTLVLTDQGMLISDNIITGFLMV